MSLFEMLAGNKPPEKQVVFKYKIPPDIVNQILELFDRFTEARCKGGSALSLDRRIREAVSENPLTLHALDPQDRKALFTADIFCIKFHEEDIREPYLEFYKFVRMVQGPDAESDVAISDSPLVLTETESEWIRMMRKQDGDKH